MRSTIPARKLFALLLLCGSGSAAAGPLTGQPPSQQLAGFILLVCLVLFVGLGLLAAAGLYAILRPEKLKLGSLLQRQAPFRTFGAGVLGIVILVGCVGLCENLPTPLRTAVLFPLMLVAAYVMLTGFAMAAHAVGEAVQSNIGSRSLGSSLCAVFYGGGLLLLLNLLPILGQVMMGLLVLLALGAGIRCFRARPTPAPAPGTAPESAGDTGD